MKRAVLPVLFAALAAGLAGAASADDTLRHQRESASYGSSVPQAPAARLVNLDGGVRWVSVAGGETVTFARGGQRFTYRFDAPGSATAEVPLSRIAPAGFGAGEVRIYISPSQEEQPIG